MTDSLVIRAGHPIWLCSAEGPELGSEQSALDIVGTLWGEHVDAVAIPAERFVSGFFELSTQLAGNFTQKIVGYAPNRPLAILGDIDRHLAASESLRAYVYESNRGRQVWFLADLDELDRRLAVGNAVRSGPGRG